MESFQTVPLDRLKESPLNPRTHFDDKKLAELADSIRGVGIIEPIVARPSKTNGHFEIIAGSRRYRAAKLAELADVPVIVRDIDDTKALELMVIENNQREDVNALEEAEGYSRLLKTGKEYKLELLAQKIGRSTKYVYDRLKLLDLIPEARKIMLGGLMTAGHAILLARLKPDDQKRAINPDFGGAFEDQRTLFERPGDKAPGGHELHSLKLKNYAGYKARSVRELEDWIAHHVRLDRAEPIVADLFPETAAAVQEAASRPKKLKIIQITDENDVDRGAKEGTTERIFSGRTWKLADGSKEGKACDKSVLGVHVLGPRRGLSMTVCVNKDCKPHWGKERAERQRFNAAPRSAAEREKEQKRYEQERARQEAEYKREQEERAAWVTASPAIIKACAEKIKSAKFGEIMEIVWRIGSAEQNREALTHLPKPKDFEGIARLVALLEIISGVRENSWQAPQEFPRQAKRFGVDVAAILKPPASAKTPATEDSKKTTKAPKKKKK